MKQVDAEIEEILVAGRDMLAVSDDLDTLAGCELLEGRSVYASDVLSSAAERFAARFGHLTRVLEGQSENSGVALRRTAIEYRESDIVAPEPFHRLETRLSPGAARL